MCKHHPQGPHSHMYTALWPLSSLFLLIESVTYKFTFQNFMWSAYDPIIKSTNTKLLNKL